jgi:solute carrier family 25 protein 14/30
MQLQGSTGDARFARTRYRGAATCLGRVVAEEGVLQLYRGLGPALLRQAVYGSIKFGLYYSSKDWLSARLALQPDSGGLRLFCGVQAGSVSSAVACPTDVIKIRMQARTAGEGHSMVRVGLDIFQQEGVRGLWRGVGPTAQRSGLLAGVQLPVYDVAKDRLALWGVQEGPWQHLPASLVAGLAAALASNPVDVVRTRMMVQRRVQEAGVGVYRYIGLQ